MDNLSKPARIAIGSIITFVSGFFLYMKSNSDDIPRDLVAVYSLIKLKRTMAALAKTQGSTLADMWEKTAFANPNKVALTFIQDDNSLLNFTYKEVDAKVNQVANLMRRKGVKKNDVVALMMDNKPEFIFAFLASAKIGSVVAFINTNLRLKPLIHSLVTSDANLFIIGSEHIDAIDEIRREAAIDSDPAHTKIREGVFMSFGSKEANFEYMDEQVAKEPVNLIGGLDKLRDIQDKLCYIYTSGTTGLPKASIITHFRFVGVGISFNLLSGYRADDVYYCALPLYHSAGGMIATSCCWNLGMQLVIRKKFSARRFWPDCKVTGATICQYIGELCGYLLDKPAGPEDSDHKLRVAIGNGLRAEFWPNFVTRFNIPQISEFYGSTEGNLGLVNALGKVGAVGHVPNIVQHLWTGRIVKYDVENDVVVRNEKGFCIPCENGEAGHFLGQIVENDATSKFAGYTSKQATEKKLIRDVFNKGDCFFMTGDLMKKDASGFVYFVDRIGDTFRWKGENVATGEVESILRGYPTIREVTVYGVSIPHSSGRAGMACIVPTGELNEFDFSKFFEFTKAQLPSYAVPVFLRFDKEIVITGTFKHKKQTLQQDGFSLDLIKEPLFIRDPVNSTYRPVTPEIQRQIEEHSLSAISAKL